MSGKTVWDSYIRIIVWLVATGLWRSTDSLVNRFQHPRPLELSSRLGVGGLGRRQRDTSYPVLQTLCQTTSNVRTLQQVRGGICDPDDGLDDEPQHSCPDALREAREAPALRSLEGVLDQPGDAVRQASGERAARGADAVEHILVLA